MNPLQKIYWIGKGVGWDNVPRRIYQSARIRTGTLRRQMQPSRFVAQGQLACLSNADTALGDWKKRAEKFFPIPTAAQLHKLVDQPVWEASVAKECEDALNGRYPFFSRWKGELGWPPNFNLDPVNDIQWPVGQHWLDTARSGPPRNDIKLVWEASRLSLAFTLARHYIYTGDEKWADAYWNMFESWRQQNPVNESVAWGCGQEVAFRLMAALFGAFATLDSEAATPSRLIDLELFCYQSALRIDANINYAQSQKNNHALSEAAGLWTVGLLFSNFPQSESWIQRGRTILEHETARQIYEDGSYVQHSMSYHRVMLDDMCWAIQLGRRNQQEFSRQTVDRVTSATRWLSEFIEPETGRVPNYGANDGANVLPLSCTDYLDYRATYQLASTVCGIASSIPAGVWSEKTLWLTGNADGSQSSAVRSDRWHARDGGYFILRGPNSQLMTRATNYRDRPGQCDTLHIDLWYQQHNVLRDAGSFRYYHENKAVKDYFYSTSAHNTVSVAGAEQMTKGPNFLWLDWPTVEATFDADGKLACHAHFHGKKPYTHSRRISRDGDSYIINDSVAGVDSFSLHWRLNPDWQWQQTGPLEVSAKVNDGTFCLRLMTESSVQFDLDQCWESLYYGERTQVPCLTIQDINGTISTQLEHRPV